MKFLLPALVAFGFAAGASDNSKFRAGVSRVELTPAPELKVALGGYGARMSKPALGVHDSVWAKALVLEKGDRKFALVTADVLAFPPRFKSAVLERLAADGWTAERIMLLPSHTHTSLDMMALHPDNAFGIPQVGVFNQDLFEFTADQLAKAVREAGGRLAPALAGSAVTEVIDRNRNRRKLTTRDTDLVVTRIDSIEGRPLAVLVNWTAHPTFMDETDMLFSGDWPGHLQRTVEALIGRGVTALYYNGAEGDQSPVPPAECASRWERAERYGREVGILAWRTWESIRPREVQRLQFHTEPIALPKRQWHADFMKTGGAEYGLTEEMMRGFVERTLPERTHSTCFRMDDLLIIGVPGEMAAQLGLEAKAKAREATGARAVSIGGMADEWVSYILPAEEYEKGGYEASMSFYGETLGATVVEGLARAATGCK